MTSHRRDTPRGSPFSGAVAVGAIVLVSTVARFAVARSFDVPWVAPDEMIYGLVGESLWETGQLTVRGATIPYYSLLTPALVGLPLTLDDLRLGVVIAQGLQALAMSLVAVPVYLWANRLVGRRWATVASILCVLPPVLWYGGFLMTEALFYTLLTAALYALARMLEEPTAMRQGTFLLFVTLAAAVRLQALLVIPAFVLAVALHAWFGRSATSLRRLLPLMALVGLAGVAALALAGRDDDALLGAYGTLGEAAPSSTGILEQVIWHLGALLVMTLGLPLLATATLIAVAAIRGEPEPAVRAFLAVTAAYVTLLVVQVSAFAVNHLDSVSGRYLVSALPPLLLGFCVWIVKGGPRPSLVVGVLVGVSLATLVALPADRLASQINAHDSVTIFPFGDIAERSDLVVRGGLLTFGLVVAVAFVAVPQRRLPVTAAAIAVGLLLASVLAAREIDRLSAVETARTFGTADPRWIDDASASPALLVDTGEHPPTSVARVAFWNRSIQRTVRLSSVPAQALPASAVEIQPDGRLLDLRGNEVSAEDVVLPTTIVPMGEELASSPSTEVAPGYRLWRVDEPLRIVSRTAGFSPVGDFSTGAKVVVYRCGPGQLELTLLGKQGLPIRVRVNGLPLDTIRPASGTVWRGSFTPLVSGDGVFPCVFELDSEGLVGSTRVEWVPDVAP